MTKEDANSEVLPSSKLEVLAVSREKADQDIAERIRLGAKMHRDLYTEYQKKYGMTKAMIENIRSEMRIWDDYNQDMLRTIFTVNSPYIKYFTSAPSVDKVSRTDSSYTHAENLLNWCRRKVDELKSIKERLPLFETAARLPGAKPAATKSVPAGDKVFIVHGHDESRKHSVARLLEHLGMRPTILHEIENRTRTVIEKLEEESVDAGYAVILLTPDDEGKSTGESESKPRARQNVIFELGFFVAKLGRKNVCALYSEGVEIPTDFDGVLYTKLDSEGAWQTKLAKELKAAGFNIDLNKLP